MAFFLAERGCQNGPNRNPRGCSWGLFEQKWCILGGLGALEARSGTRAAKRSVSGPKRSLLLEVIVVLFRYLCGGFFSAFSGTLIFVFLADFGAPRCPKGRFWGSLFHSSVWTDGNGGTDTLCLPAAFVAVVAYLSWLPVVLLFLSLLFCYYSCCLLFLLLAFTVVVVVAW